MVSLDTVAPFYRALETLVFGNALQRARIAFIPALNRCRRALVLGQGNGRFVVALLAANPQIRVTCIDQSPKMIQLARRRVCDVNRVEFVQSAIEDARLERTYDAVVTNFVLDFFTEDELASIVQKLAQHANRDATWLIAEFTNARRGELLLALMYAFFRFVAQISASRLPNYAPLLQRHGFRREERQLFYAGIVCAELWKRS